MVAAAPPSRFFNTATVSTLLALHLWSSFCLRRPFWRPSLQADTKEAHRFGFASKKEAPTPNPTPADGEATTPGVAGAAAQQAGGKIGFPTEVDTTLAPSTAGGTPVTSTPSSKKTASTTSVQASPAPAPTFAVGVPLIPRDLQKDRLRDLLYDSVVNQEVPPEEFVVFFSGKVSTMKAEAEHQQASSSSPKILLSAAARAAVLAAAARARTVDSTHPIAVVPEAAPAVAQAPGRFHQLQESAQIFSCRTEYNATTADRAVKNIEVETCRGKLVIPPRSTSAKSEVEESAQKQVAVTLLWAKRVGEKPLARSFSPGVGRNWIARVAASEYIAFLDSDDFAFPDRIKWLKKAAVKSGLPHLIAARWSFPVVRVVRHQSQARGKSANEGLRGQAQLLEEGSEDKLMYDSGECSGSCNGFGPQLRKFVQALPVYEHSALGARQGEQASGRLRRLILVGHFVGDVRAARRYEEAKWSDLSLSALSVQCGAGETTGAPGRTTTAETNKGKGEDSEYVKVNRTASPSSRNFVELKDGKMDSQLALLVSERSSTITEGTDCVSLDTENAENRDVFLRLTPHILKRYKERGRWYLEWYPYGHITVKREAAVRMPYPEIPKYGAQRGEDQRFISRILTSTSTTASNRMAFLENLPLTAKYMGRRRSSASAVAGSTLRRLDRKTT
ncbi:unnamed protein product [Amoebophrya sp. A120]|nr:unnamed protein product [Amoebophrya sp. A120]|eukprot:GSA120T00020645001.1